MFKFSYLLTNSNNLFVIRFVWVLFLKIKLHKSNLIQFMNNPKEIMGQTVKITIRLSIYHTFKIDNMQRIFTKYFQTHFT